MPVGPDFDRARVRTLLFQDRRWMRRIRSYFEAAVPPYRGVMYRCIERADHPIIAEQLRGLPQAEFMERAPDFTFLIPSRCAMYYFRIRDLKQADDRIGRLIERAYIRGEGLSNEALLNRSIDLMEQEREFYDDIIDTLETIGTATALDRARDARRADKRAEEKHEELQEMLVPPPEVFREREVVSLYIIIEGAGAGRGRHPGGKRYRKPGEYSVKRKYPAGKFQAAYDITAVKRREWDTEEGQWKVETVERVGLENCKRDFIRELAEYFGGVGTGRGVAQADYVSYSPADVTVGDSNLVPQTDVDDDPYKRTLGRMVERVQAGDSPYRPYQMKISDFIPARKVEEYDVAQAEIVE